MGLNENKSLKEILKLKLSEQRIVGMFSGYFFTCVLVEYENGERQVVGWGHNA